MSDAPVVNLSSKLTFLFLLNRSTPTDSPKDEVYEVDADPDRIDEEMTRSQADSITKQGYLYKGPDSASDRMFAHIGSKSFKRRYCYLRQEVDGTYILELHKDEKQCEAKATIVMDFCTEVVTVSYSCQSFCANVFTHKFYFLSLFRIQNVVDFVSSSG